jgi:hypothetical protein
MAAYAPAGGESPAVQWARSSALAATRAAAVNWGNAAASRACSSVQAPQLSDVATSVIDTAAWNLSPNVDCQLDCIANTVTRAQIPYTQAQLCDEDNVSGDAHF